MSCRCRHTVVRVEGPYKYSYIWVYGHSTDVSLHASSLNPFIGPPSGERLKRKYYMQITHHFYPHNFFFELKTLIFRLLHISYNKMLLYCCIDIRFARDKKNKTKRNNCESHSFVRAHSTRRCLARSFDLSRSVIRLSVLV